MICAVLPSEFNISKIRNSSSSGEREFSDGRLRARLGAILLNLLVARAIVNGCPLFLHFVFCPEDPCA